MCLNADIERQYEFIQQTWVSAGSFHGLSSPKRIRRSVRSDGKGGSRFRHGTASLMLQGIPQFVTTLGGGYFFMPSRSALRYLTSRL